MIISYCLSVYAVSLFSPPTFSKFKLRLINQQTGDCTDSSVLDAKTMKASDFPLLIKLKGGERLLMKVKLLTQTNQENEKLIGQGVVSFSKNDIDNSLRVPIYDRSKGIEEVAICSVDLFITGFAADRNKSLAVDKSKSGMEDWRQRSEEAVYTSMSYTLQSQNDGSEKKSHRNEEKQIIKMRQVSNSLHPAKISIDKAQQHEDSFAKRVKQIEKKETIKSRESRSISPRQDKKISSEKQVEGAKKFSFPLQNSVYFVDHSKNKERNRQSSVSKATNKQKQGRSVRQQIVGTEDEGRNDTLNQSQELSPQKLREKVKENEKLMEQLKKYLKDKQNQQQQNYSQTEDLGTHRHKIRRRNIKIQEITSYKSQNAFLKYYIMPQNRPHKIIKGLRAVKIVKNQLKQTLQDQTIDISLNNLQLCFANSNKKIVTYDFLGYRSFCITNRMKQSSVDIKVPASEEGVKVEVILNDEGQFEGTIGLQQGEEMSIYLHRKSNIIGSVLNKQEFKLYFEIKHQHSPKKLSKNPPSKREHDISFREPYEVTGQNDLRRRITSQSLQPWGYVKSYSEGVKVSEQTKIMLDKINSQLPRLTETKDKRSSEKSNITTPRAINSIQKTKKLMASLNEDSVKKSRQKFDQKEYTFLIKKFCTSDQQSENQSAINLKKQKEYLENSPIKKKKKKKEPVNLTEQEAEAVNDINSIRNGNRYNYKFKKEQQDRKIKQLWQKQLIKKQLEQQKAQKDQINKYRQSVDSVLSRKRKNTQYMNESSILKDSSDSEMSKSKLYGVIPSSKKAKRIMTEPHQNETETNLYPLRNLSIQIKNISITQPQHIVEEDRNQSAGKFVKLSIADKISYFTEVIFNGEFNSILWKLEGCIFPELTGNQKLICQIYQTVDNRIRGIGKSHIRVNKLHFLRNNHIYNGKISHGDNISGEFTLGFDVQQFFPFAIIEEEEDEQTIKPKSTAREIVTKNQKNSNKFQTVGQNKTASKKPQQQNQSPKRQNSRQTTLKNTKKNVSKQSNQIRWQDESLNITKSRAINQSIELPNGLRVQ